MTSPFGIVIFGMLLYLLGCCLVPSVKSEESDGQGADDSFLTTIMYLGQGQK